MIGRYRDTLQRWICVALMTCGISACAPTIMVPGPDVQLSTMSGTAFAMPDGESLPMHVWSPEAANAAVIAVHGFNDYGLFFNDMAEYLVGEGVISYSYDQRGFGAARNRGYWAGSDAYISDLKQVFRLVKQRHPDIPIFLFGESMGGAVLMAAASRDTQNELTANGYILAAPAVWARETMPFYQRWALSLISHTMPWLQVSGRGLEITPSDNIEMLQALGRDPLVIKETRVDTVWGLVNLMDRALAGASTFDKKALILYGAKDEIIKKHATETMFRRLPRVPSTVRRVVVYENGYHMLIRDLAAEKYWRDVVSWMRFPSEPLPSGTDQSGWHALEN